MVSSIGFKKVLHALVLALGMGAVTAWASPPVKCAPADAKADWDLTCLRQAYAGASSTWPAPIIDAGVTWQELALVPKDAPYPADNPPTPAKIALGQKLFFDPRVSRKGEASCATCHQPAKSFTDGNVLAVGDERLQGRRRTQTLFGSPFAPNQFWDGRAATLEEQVLMPVDNVFELNHGVKALAEKLRSLPDYQPLVQQAFGRDAMTEQDIAHSLASFVRTIRPPETKFDDFLKGDRQALTDQQLLGLHLFRTKARCMNCHSGPLMTDFKFHDLGLSFYGRRNQDLGRFEVTRDKAHLGQFKTPSLRGVALAAPYMHNGIFPTLRGTLNMYNNGMGVASSRVKNDPYLPPKSPMIQRLGLTVKEIDALEAWLNTL